MVARVGDSPTRPPARVVPTAVQPHRFDAGGHGASPWWGVPLPGRATVRVVGRVARWRSSSLPLRHLSGPASDWNNSRMFAPRPRATTRTAYRPGRGREETKSTMATPDTESSPSGDTGDSIETIPNKERGCGFLKEGKAYLKGDLSPDGVLPPFVEFTTPIPFHEGHIRGYTYFPGVQFEASVTPAASAYEPDLDGDTLDDAGRALHPDAVRDYADALDTMRDMDVSDTGWLTRTDPPLEAERHVKRVRQHAPGADHVGAMRVARAHDLLMWVGESYYETPEAFIDECKSMGLSKAIPTSKNQEPPVINPGKTRVFLIHPRAVPMGHDEDGEPSFAPGIIGYAYVTRVVYTGVSTGDGGVEFPEWAREYAASDYFDLVRVGERVPADAHENGSTIGDFVVDEPGDGADHRPVDAAIPADTPEADAQAEFERRDVDLSDQAHADIDASREQVERGETTPLDEVVMREAEELVDDMDTADAVDDDERETVHEVLDDVPYNRLKQAAAENDVDVGTSPSKPDLVDALVDAGVARGFTGGADGE